MKKIITITGHKNSKKDYVAESLAKNSEVVFVRPYTDKQIPLGEIAEVYGDYHYVLKATLDSMIETEKVISMITVNGNRYVYFEFQLTGTYNVLIVDDYGLLDLKDRWKGNVYSVLLYSVNQEQSKRVEEYLNRHEFDEVFDVDNDDIYELEARIE